MLESGGIGGARGHSGDVGELVAEGGGGGGERGGERRHLLEPPIRVIAGGERQQLSALLLCLRRRRSTRLPPPPPAALGLRRGAVGPPDLEEIDDLGLDQRELCIPTKDNSPL